MEILGEEQEINEVGGQAKKSKRGLQCWGYGEFDHLCKDSTVGIDDGKDQGDDSDRTV